VPVALLGWRAWRAGLALPADQAAPLYVRDKVAQTTAERDAAKAQRLLEAASVVAAAAPALPAAQSPQATP
jgi:tRNA threonylcarbamoyladenosine biosynthesis protein TsaB